MTSPDLTGRHQATQHVMRLLKPNPALNGIAMDVSALIWETACDLVVILGDGPELTAGLRRLWDAKNSLVFQALSDSGMVA